MKKIELADGVTKKLNSAFKSEEVLELTKQIINLCKKRKENYITINKALYLSDKKIYEAVLNGEYDYSQLEREKTDDVNLVDYRKASMLVKELGRKMTEANGIAERLTLTTIQVQDVRGGQENINKYIEKVEQEFFESYGFKPKTIRIIAEGSDELSQEKVTLSLPLFYIK